MTNEAKKARREYINAYRRRNPDKVKIWNENYWQRRAEKAAALEDNDEKEGEKA